MNHEALALATVAATSVPQAFLLVLPPTSTVHQTCGDPAAAQAVRRAYLPATLLSIGLGGLLSYLTKSPLPVAFAAGATGLMIGLYEQAMPPHPAVRQYLT